MNDEIAYLENNPDFEMPYGRAWFLKLTRCYENVTGDLQYRQSVDRISDGVFLWL